MTAERTLTLAAQTHVVLDRLAAPAAEGSSPTWESTVIREMRPSDARQLAELWLASYPPSVTNDVTLAEAQKDFETTFKGAYGDLVPGANWVAETSAGALIGTAQIACDVPWNDAPRGAFLIELFVRPSARRSGLARGLLRAAVAGARTAGHQRLALRVTSSNAGALDLYRSIGFDEGPTDFDERPTR